MINFEVSFLTDNKIAKLFLYRKQTILIIIIWFSSKKKENFLRLDGKN